MDEMDEDGDKAIVRSVRFKPSQWLTVQTHCKAHGVRHGSFLRNAALKAAGGTTESESTRELAAALDRSLERPAAVERTKPKAKKRR